MDTITLLEMIASLTAYAIAITAETYIKRYNSDVWETLNQGENSNEKH